MDVPDVSLDMLRNFVFGVSFDDYEQRLERAPQGSGTDNCPVCPAPTKCEDCPACPAPIGNTDDDERQSSGENKAIVPSSMDGKNQPLVTLNIPNVGWEILMAASLASVVLIAGLCYCSGYCGRQRKAYRESSVVPEYDMELPSSSYTDKPELNGEIS